MSCSLEYEGAVDERTWDLLEFLDTMGAAGLIEGAPRRSAGTSLASRKLVWAWFSVRSFSMVKKQWRKPDVKQIEAGAAEKNAGALNDGAANKS
jgi:hypothetical protein